MRRWDMPKRRYDPPPSQHEPEWLDEGERLAMEDDPVRVMHHLRQSYSGPGGHARDRMLIGLGGEIDGRPYTRLVATQKQEHLLALGPPRSHAGKTASMMIPIVLSQLGPVVTASTKPDILTATAMARAQHGHLWCYCPDGETAPPGFRELHWSPISEAEDWGTALTTADEMVRTLDVSDLRSGGHWRDRAADLLAAVFHWAALTGGTMRDARTMVYEFNTPAGDGDETMGQGVLRSLSRHGRSKAATAEGARDAAMLFRSVLHTAREERASIASTAARALAGYRLPGAMRSTESPNFDADDFVRGGEHEARADTIYIVASSKNQALVAPLVVAFLGQIRTATYLRHRERPDMRMVTMVLDELFGLAPLPDLPLWLSDAGSQSLLLACAVQDLTLVQSRWPKESDSFLTLFGHVLVFPGIRDVKTLDALSKLVGMWDKSKRTESQSGYTSGWSETTERVPILDPSTISQGVEPENLNILLHLEPGGVGSIRALPYWWAAPWPHILTEYLELGLGSPWPVPNLNVWAWGTRTNPDARPCDRRWAPRYLAAIGGREIPGIT
jgi:type IV secretory pathway TraG/TraD family ATPase VirD4